MENPTLQPVGMVGMDFTTLVMARSINKNSKLRWQDLETNIYETSPKANMELQKWRRMDDGRLYYLFDF